MIRTVDIDEIKQMSENRAKAGNPGKAERVVIMKEAEKERPGQEEFQGSVVVV